MTRSDHEPSPGTLGGFGLLGGIVLLCVAHVSVGLAGCATGSGGANAHPDAHPAEILRTEAADDTSGDRTPVSAPEEDPSSVEDRWGVRILGVRLSAADAMLDFRFRVLDPSKALPLTNPNRKPYLINQASGAKLMVPTPPRFGAQRRAIMVEKPKADRTYSLLFTNSGRSVQAGSKVTVVIGDFRADLTVESEEEGRESTGDRGPHAWPADGRGAPSTSRSEAGGLEFLSAWSTP